VAELGTVEPIHMRGIALAVLFAVASHDGGERATMEGAIEYDGAPPIGLPADIEIAARELQGALDSFRTAVGKECAISEARLAQAIRQALLTRNTKLIRYVP